LDQLSHEGRKTGGVYGFITTMSKYILRFKPTNIVICMDTKPYIRSEIYPQYKMDRKALGDKDLDAVRFTNMILPLMFKSLGIPVLTERHTHSH